MRLDFIAWQNLFETSWNVEFSTTNIIDINYSGEAISNLYFNQTEASSIDVVLDTDGLFQYIDFKPQGSPFHPSIFKYGVKLYDDNDILQFTGIIFIDSIKINPTLHKIAFSITSSLGMLIRANQNKEYTITSNQDDAKGPIVPPTNNIPITFQELVNELWEASAETVFNPHQNISITRPNFNYAGVNITSPFNGQMGLPDYNNDFPSNEADGWNLSLEWWWMGVNPVITQRFSVGLYPVISPADGGTKGPFTPPIIVNKLCIFMFCELKGIEASTNKVCYEHRLKVYTINTDLMTGTLKYNSHKTFYGTGIYADVVANNDITTVIGNGNDWLAIPESRIYQGSNYTITGQPNFGSQSDWLYNGVIILDDVEIKPDNKISPMKALGDLLMVKQSAMMSLPNGDIQCVIRPLNLGVANEVSINNSELETPSYSGVFLKSNVSSATFDYIAGRDTIIGYLMYYYEQIIKYYKVKLTAFFDGEINIQANVGNKFFYENIYWVITKVKPDYLNHTTEIEAYGTGIAIAQDDGKGGTGIIESAEGLIWDSMTNIIWSEDDYIDYDAETLANPYIVPESGTYSGSVDITIIHDDPEATIIYTTDGSEPVLPS